MYEVPDGVDRRLVTEAHNEYLAPFYQDTMSSQKILVKDKKELGKIIGEVPEVTFLSKKEFLHKLKLINKKKNLTKL